MDPQVSQTNLAKRDLRSWHIFLIAISGTVGMGLFGHSGTILGRAGPGGGILVYFIVSICAIFVMDGITEMIARWPISNAMFEFVDAFVDKELSIVMTLAYWYANSSSYGSLMLAAAHLADRWTWYTPGHDWVYIAGAVVVTAGINSAGVKWFGHIEAILGVVKIALVVVVIVVMNIITHDTVPNGASKYTYINRGFKNNPEVTNNWFLALLSCIPIATYSYLGVELVAVTAAEAKDPQKSLKHPARLIALITGIGYVLSVTFFYFNVLWTDPRLSTFNLVRAKSDPTVSRVRSIPPVIIALDNAGQRWGTVGSGVVNAFLILAVVSTANTALYVASRTLWGLSSRHELRFFSRLSRLTRKTSIPGFAVAASAIPIPLLTFILNQFSSKRDWQESMSGIATSGVVLVWASQCLAYIRYKSWQKPFSERDSPYNLDDGSGTPPSSFYGFLNYWQPIPAWIGFLFCMAVVFVLPTVPWWNRPTWYHYGSPASDARAVYLGPGILLFIWVSLKVRRYFDSESPRFEWWVPAPTRAGFRRTVDDLNLLVYSKGNTTSSIELQSMSAMIKSFIHKVKNLFVQNIHYRTSADEQRPMAQVTDTSTDNMSRNAPAAQPVPETTTGSDANSQNASAAQPVHETATGSDANYAATSQATGSSPRARRGTK